ncbi:uracil-DNA glycosylase-like protein [Halteromyces radiatus]|uniref:uracil-DNA glycosylase-like protein n=1 Tax=Halteromyces radiatus TaxID=101107 RepID=UPI00221F5F08|nr:uracil-DNA glycosylase-like protein [Halteromyces radiatus]KAI8086312.1 uracil-DNA glycosylase-like protein [Halteromyces radiatus]
MQTTNKRPALTDSREGVKKQATLTSMFKPSTTTTKTVVTVTEKQMSTTFDQNLTENNTDLVAKLFDGLDDETKNLLHLEMTTMHQEWLKVLRPELTKPYFIKLKKYLKQELLNKQVIYPPAKDIYSWSNYTPPSNIKVVIIGQDPYHGPKQAHGLCFSVAKGVPTPPSLVNIYKALINDYPNFKKPDHGYLENWAKQGVLMLNTSLTVRRAAAASHSNQGWEPFTDAVIDYLNEKKSNIVFLLWGSHAQKKGAKINKSKHLVLKSVHPSPLSAHRGFFDCQHFVKANNFLESRGRTPINWDCLED